MQSLVDGDLTRSGVFGAKTLGQEPAILTPAGFLIAGAQCLAMTSCAAFNANLTADNPQCGFLREIA